MSCNAVLPQLQQYFYLKTEPLQRAKVNVGCAKWTNNTYDSVTVTHLLKQRMQWHLTYLHELVEKLHGLVGLKEQMNEADRALSESETCICVASKPTCRKAK